MPPSSKQTAVVLAGGGAYAAWEVGVIQGLIEGRSPGTMFQPLVPDIYTGTSAGAINAAVMTGEQTPRAGVERLREVWLDQISNKYDGRGNGVFRLRFNPLDYCDPRKLTRAPSELAENFVEDVRFAFSDLVSRGNKLFSASHSDPIRQRVAELFDTSLFLSTTSFQRAAKNFLKLEAIQSSQIALQVIVTNWEFGTAKSFGNADFSEGKGIKILLDAATIPGVFPMHDLDSVPLVDGTIVENTPLLPAIKLGASEIHLIEPPNPADFPPSSVPSLAESFYRTIVTSLSTLLERDIQRAEHRNHDLEVFERLNIGEAIDDFSTTQRDRAIFRNAIQHHRGAYRKVTVHRYKPVHEFGYVGGLLNFGRIEIQRSIKAGYRAAVEHDCRLCGCVCPNEDLVK